MSTLPIERILLLVIFATMAMGCSPIAKDGQLISSGAPVTLRAGQTVGQTFQARDSGLDGIQVYLSPQTQGAGTLRMHLRNASISSADIETASLPVQQVNTPTFYRFGFSPRDDSFKHAYYFLLDVEGEGSVQVAAAPGDVFLDGALYQDGNPVDAQATFRLTYDPVRLGLGLLSLGASWLGFLAISVFLYVFPGLALLTLLWRDGPRVSWGEKLGLAIGISVALYPLLLLWTHLVGLQLGALYAWIPPLASLAFLVWHHRKLRLASLINSLRALRRSDSFLPDAVLIFLIVLIVFTRFWVIRTLDVPMWGDSYQHTMIAQLIVDNGGLFDSWQPYADLQTLTYHFGFHAAAAAFHWVSGAEMPQAVLWVGQIFNVFAALALCPLALRVGKSRWAGIGAVLIAGLVSPMPMYYLNWGRYTQLAGQMILPSAVILAWVVLAADKRDWRLITLGWIAWGGLALTHYRIAIFGALFIVAFLILNLRRSQARAMISRTLSLAMGAAFLFLPWFVHMFAGRLPLFFGTQLTTPVQATSTSFQEYNSAIGELAIYLPIFVWVLLPLSIAWGLLRRDKGIALVSLWWLLILLAANPQWLRLAGEGIISNFAVLIAAYIPASILVGGALGWLHSARQITQYRFRVATLIMLIVGVGLWGIGQRVSDLHIAQHSLVTTSDTRAATWIRENTPTNSRFLVNSFFAYSGTIVVGSDGGWWLPLLAHRSTTLPPINYASESGPRADYIAWVNALTATIQSNDVASPEFIKTIRERGVTHIYIGQRQGRANYAGPSALSPERMLASPSFRVVYHQDRVWVFEVAS